MGSSVAYRASTEGTIVSSLPQMCPRKYVIIFTNGSTKEIAAALSIAPSTLKTHTLRLFDKTGRHRRSELVRLAAEVRAPG